jgi:D-alanyl-lipoteichoic acid acyltransferase DltB (MBOAT superfamily)
MTLAHITVFIAAALAYAWLMPVRWRRWMLLVGSVIAVYWLQPTLPIRSLDFALPTATLALSVAVWWATNNHHLPSLYPSGRGGEIRWTEQIKMEDWRTLGVMAVLVVGLSLTRYLVPELRPTASRAPDTLAVIVALLVLAGVGTVLVFLWRKFAGKGLKPSPTGIVIILIVGLFIILKTEPMAARVSAGLRGLSGQNPELAAGIDLRWLGFSYIAFRLIHMLRDWQTGVLPTMSLREHMTYVIFFPALTAGPIDRAERFVADERALPETLTAPCRVEAARRISVGLVKKFVISDGLALFALNPVNAEQATSTPALWLLLYAYAFRLFLDFSGYTDIAIGIGLLVGIRLPENFNQPYIKSNLAAFWQSWHMTLSNWVRFYVFSPLSRLLLVRKARPLTAVFAAQMATMIVIGLWHGVAWTFLMWGAWHGIGLFIHKVWSDRTRKRYLALKQRPRLERVWNLAGILLTFHFVTLGWVWFALGDVGRAWSVFLRLLGIA